MDPNIPINQHEIDIAAWRWCESSYHVVANSTTDAYSLENIKIEFNITYVESLYDLSLFRTNALSIWNF